MSQANVDLLKTLYAAFARGDIPAVLAALDPRVEWNEAENFPYADRNPYIGPQAVLEGVFLRLGTEWDSFFALPEEFLDAGGTVVVRGRYDGVYKATGRSIHAQYVHVFRVTNGKITGFQQYCDTAQVRDAVSRGQATGA
jgi:ketosteroid isomerase-like protein